MTDNRLESTNTDKLLLAATIENVLPFYLKKARAGLRVCLVTLFNVDDVSPRPIGSQIAVCEDGDSFGFITGGCAEAAIVHEAMMAIRERSARCIRIGSDSPWFDIKLPCGAGIDLHFSVADSAEVIEQTCNQLSRRKPVTLELDVSDDGIRILPDGPVSMQQNRRVFVRQYLPHRRLTIIGAGPYVQALESMAKLTEFQVACWSPEFDTLPRATSQQDWLPADSRHQHLSRRTKIPLDDFDAWTAAAVLFHEHDWEPNLLEAILKSDCFYIGALGSQKTHAARLEKLRDRGLAEPDLEKIHGPVGLSIGARTPAEIALSIMSEIVARYRELMSVGFRLSQTQ